MDQGDAWCCVVASHVSCLIFRIHNVVSTGGEALLEVGVTRVHGCRDAPLRDATGQQRGVCVLLCVPVYRYICRAQPRLIQFSSLLDARTGQAAGWRSRVRNQLVVCTDVKRRGRLLALLGKGEKKILLVF